MKPDHAIQMIVLADRCQKSSKGQVFRSLNKNCDVGSQK